MIKRFAAGAVVAALAVFPAGAGATNGNGNSDEQLAPSCESGQIEAIIFEGADPSTHFPKFLQCADQEPPNFH